MKTVMNYKNLLIVCSISLTIAGVWIGSSNILGLPDVVKGAGAFLITYSATWWASGIYPTYSFKEK